MAQPLSHLFLVRADIKKERIASKFISSHSVPDGPINKCPKYIRTSASHRDTPLQLTHDSAAGELKSSISQPLMQWQGNSKETFLKNEERIYWAIPDGDISAYELKIISGEE